MLKVGMYTYITYNVIPIQWFEHHNYLKIPSHHGENIILFVNVFFFLNNCIVRLTQNKKEFKTQLH